jgi:hypothetical protein
MIVREEDEVVPSYNKNELATEYGKKPDEMSGDEATEPRGSTNVR